MNKFHFTLQSLLDSREALENAAAAKLAHATRVLEKARQECCSLIADLKQIMKEMESFCGVRVAQHKVATHLKYIERMQRAIETKNRQIVSLETKMEECRNKLYEAMRERKVLERLCDTERARWQDEQRKYEQKEMDEHAQISYSRSKGSTADID